jgi:methylmalonyl-CoA mutase N-terminal domain/subunit
LAIDEFAPRLSFWDIWRLFGKSPSYGRRRIWARHMKERFGAKDPRSWMMRFHSQTAGVTLTAQQPMNNVVRVAYQALAAVLGGTQSLHTNSMDETLALPTEHSVQVALRTQQVLAFETGVPNVIDPLGGSYRRGTHRSTGAGGGGAVRRIRRPVAWSRTETGWFQRRIAESAADGSGRSSSAGV